MRYCFNPVSGNLLIPCCEHHRNTLVFLSFVPGANPQLAGPQVWGGTSMPVLHSLYITQTAGHTHKYPTGHTGQPRESPVIRVSPFLLEIHTFLCMFGFSIYLLFFFRADEDF